MSVSWFDGVTVTVEAALSAATGTYGVWNSGKWDTATWGPDVVWTDISAYLRSVTTTRRFDRAVTSWQAGSATIVLDNRDGRFSPDNLSGPYVSAGVTAIRPWRPLRVRITYNSVTYALYTGYAVDWVESWSQAPTGQGDATVTVPCLDEWARLAGFDGFAQTPVGGGDTSGRRIHRILDNAGHTGTRAVAVGRTTVQATTLAANAATELKLTADSEGGAVFIDPSGMVVFEDQYALMEQAHSNTIQATWGDNGGAELPYGNVQTAYSGDLIRNLAQYARVGGSQQTAADATSRALYGDRQDARTDLVCETDGQALALATFTVERLKQPERRIVQITIPPRNSPATLFPQVLGRQVRDLVRVIRRPAGGATITRDCHIAGILHAFDVTGQWTTTFELSSATVYQTYATSRWDVGTWDNAAWFF